MTDDELRREVAESEALIEALEWKAASVRVRRQHALDEVAEYNWARVRSYDRLLNWLAPVTVTACAFGFMGLVVWIWRTIGGP